MDDAYDVPDSTDWLPTPLKGFAPLENALHCQICKEFYDTPMITSCNHTFCSRCIRTSLSADGRCPACRASDQANKLRNNWAIQEVVSTFLEARPTALDVARKFQHETEAPKSKGKRKRPVVPNSGDMVGEVEGHQRTTRAKSRRIAASQTSQQETIEIGDSDDEGGEELILPPSPPKDGLVECPLGCGKRMKEAVVFNHLDTCEDEQKQTQRASSRTPLNGLVSSRPPPGQGARPQDRINELNYGMLKDKALSSKLKDQGLPAFGSKQLMVNRHREWVNIWNANCDSNNPRSRRDLLRDLDVWEKTQGGKAPQGNGLSHAVMRKDFDGSAYSKRHQDDFSRLIADARRKKSNPASAPPPAAKDNNIEKQVTDCIVTNGDGKSPFFAIDPPPLTGDEQDKEIGPADRPQADAVDCTPYEHDPEAFSNLAEKVRAINQGQTPEPVLNAGFQNPAASVPGRRNSLPTQSESDTPAPKEETPSIFNSTIEPATPGVDLNKHTSSNHRRTEPTGMDTMQALQRASTASMSDHHGDCTGSPCELSTHVISSQPRRVPMFTMPEQPVTDVEGCGGGSIGGG